MLKEIQAMGGMAQTNADMADELEKFIWAKWMPRLRRITFRSFGGSNHGSDTYEYTAVSSPFTRSAVETRLDDLGILLEAGVKIKWHTEAGLEVDKLID